MTNRPRHLSRILARRARTRAFYTLLFPICIFAACDLLTHFRVSVAEEGDTQAFRVTLPRLP